MNQVVPRLPDSKAIVGDNVIAPNMTALPSGPIRIFRHLVFSGWLFFLLNFFVRKLKIDVVDVQSGPGGVFLLKKPPAKLLATVHQSYSLTLRHNPGSKLTIYYRVMRHLERMTLRMCDKIIVLSDFVKKSLVNDLSIDEAQIVVLPSPPAKYFRKIKIVKKDYVLFVGRLEQKKGIFELVEAFDSPEVPWQLILVGSGSKSKDLKAFIANRNLEQKVSIVDWIDHKDLVRFYNEARLTVMPSFFEPFGYVALESLACGTPCIVSANSGAAEIISEIDRDLILNEISVESIRESVVRNMQKQDAIRPLKLTWERYIDEYQKLLCSLVH